MFVQKIPYQSVQRRRIRHWFLLLMRAAAIALIVAAFARPFFPQGAAAALAAVGGSREVVILLDQSASMGYGDHWQRAPGTRPRARIGSLGVGDRATLVLFDRNAEESIRATSDRGRLEAALNAAKLTAGGTRYGPALKLAESILARSTLQRREAILISDFQKTGWTGSEDVHFGEGLTLTPVSVASTPTHEHRRAVGDVRARHVLRTRSGSPSPPASPTRAPRPRPTCRCRSRSTATQIETQDRQHRRQRLGVGHLRAVHAGRAGGARRGQGRHRRRSPADNSFDFVLTPSQAVSVLVVDSGTGADSSFYLSKALGIGNAPAFQVETVPAARVTPQMLERRSVVVLNDTPLPPGARRRRAQAVRRTRRRPADRASATAPPGRRTKPTSCPGTLGRGRRSHRRTRRARSASATTAIRSSSCSRRRAAATSRPPRVLRYRAHRAGARPTACSPASTTAAVAAVEKRVGTGRVIAWTTTLDDSWNDLALKPVYLPLVHQLTRYLGAVRAERRPGRRSARSSISRRCSRPRPIASSSRRRANGGRCPCQRPGVLELNEHGVYEIRVGVDAVGAARSHRGQPRPRRVRPDRRSTRPSSSPRSPAVPCRPRPPPQARRRRN